MNDTLNNFSSQIYESNKNLVEFYVDKPIETEFDLSDIIVYLENLKASGGGDISNFDLDSKTKQVLAVSYKNEKSKLRVLKKRVHTFENYALIANEPSQAKTFELSNKILIIRNLNREELCLDLIRIYCENLVTNDNEENDVESIEFSNLFKNTLYVKFKLDFDYEAQLIHRINRRPMLKGKALKFMRAFDTNTIAIRQNDSNNNRQDFFKRLQSIIDSDSFDSVRLNGKYFLVRLKTRENCDQIIDCLKNLSENQSSIERIYNYELLSEDIYPNESSLNKLGETKEALDDEKSAKTIENESISEENGKEPMILEEFSSPKEPVQTLVKPVNAPFIILNFDDDPKIGKVLLNFDFIFYEQIKFDLEQNFGSLVEFVDENKGLKISYEKTQAQENEMINWEQLLREYLSENFKEFDIRTAQMSHADILTKIEYDQLRLSINILQENDDQSLICEIVGFRKCIDEILAKIEAENKRFLERKDEIVTDQIANLKLHEIRILYVIKFIISMKEKYPAININMNSKSGTIDLKGTRAQIEQVKMHVQTILRTISKFEYESEHIVVRFLREKERDVVNWIRDKKFLCALDTDLSSNSIIVYSIDKKNMDDCVRALKNDIYIQSFDAIIHDLDEELVFEKLNRIAAKENDGFVNEFKENKSLKICGFRNTVQNVYTFFLEEFI